jgi:type II secretory ATPase GspE/PulE/Tfp pilus assembly ATPase PilB-like protein
MINREKADDSSYAVRLVDTIVRSAIERAASDIHLECHQQAMRIRFRIDGLLYDQQELPLSHAQQILSRIKILAHLNSAERRIPQDGKFCFHHNGIDIDLRVSSFPSLYGEKIVIRILDRSHMMIALDTLGMQSHIYQQCEALIAKPHGLFLVTGPTGSGKTTTLYAALSVLNTTEKNIITLEDPIEYNLSNVTQGQVYPDVGFTFAQGIRSMLRQDPDVVMIGEVRDKETARIAIEAALTGHMVLSTLHTNDAPSTIMRLMDMGIEPFLINAALSGVLAQRLARKLCTACRFMRAPDEQEMQLMQKLNFSVPTLFDAPGCNYCFNLGYKGRVGIFELLMMSNALRALIVQQPLFDAIAKQVLVDGMQTLLEDAQYKVKQGIISLKELARVVL